MLIYKTNKKIAEKIKQIEGEKVKGKNTWNVQKTSYVLMQALYCTLNMQSKIAQPYYFTNRDNQFISEEQMTIPVHACKSRVAL